jgi:hypothetical protein
MKSAEELIKSQTTTVFKEVVNGKLTGKSVNRKTDGCATWTRRQNCFDKFYRFCRYRFYKRIQQPNAKP